MDGFREEKDFIGILEVPSAALYGIHALRANKNFPDSTPFHLEWYKAVGDVKHACYETYGHFVQAARQRNKDKPLPFEPIKDEIIAVLKEAALEVSQGKHFESFIVPAISGGAGTSINMNVNEIIANRALLMLGSTPGDYMRVDPIESANVYQSTNDVVPTALRVAAMRLLRQLEADINSLRQKVEMKEREFRGSLRVAYTQMQEAVPSSYGMLFAAYSEALSRDWWRISKCFERIKTVNLGGSAVGTAVAVPRYFVMEVAKVLQKNTGLPITRSENMPDATQNLDGFVEVHAVLKAHAVNLEKMVSDLRLLASDVAWRHEVRLPQRQVGSSIMPGKINPVIPEFVVSAAHKVYANDGIVTSLSAQGCLDLNAYVPIIGHALLETLKLLSACCRTLAENLFNGLVVNPQAGQAKLFSSAAITTVLSPLIGYHQSSLLAKYMQTQSVDVFEANSALGILAEEKIRQLLQADNLLKSGFTLDDLE